MNRLDARLVDVLEPVRDMAVGEILEVMARTLDSGMDVKPEPKRRNARGQVLREGALSLPRRGDLLVQHSGGMLTQHVPCERVLSFEPVTLVEPDGFVSVITAFRWDAAVVIAEREAPETRPDWSPLRRWYLEWFQSRFSDEAPDLDGAVHSLAGPEEVESGWRFVFDFGSAPVDAIADLIAAFAATGVPRIRIGTGAYSH